MTASSKDPSAAPILAARYRIESRIAHGEDSTVFRATDLRTSRAVALKLMGEGVTTERRLAFEREASILEQLDHPNVVRFHDRGAAADGVPFIVMQLLVGKTLRHDIGTPSSPERAATLVADILRGLVHVHEHGVIHRDITPDNVHIETELGGQEVARLIDFGRARPIERDTQDRPVTLTGVMSNPSPYDAPERIIWSQEDVRTDLYAVGIIFYELLTGTVPWGDDPVVGTNDAEDMPALPRSASELSPIVRRLTDKDRKHRYPSAHQALRDVQAYLGGNPFHVQVAARRRQTAKWRPVTHDTPTSGIRPGLASASSFGFDGGEELPPTGSRGARWSAIALVVAVTAAGWWMVRGRPYWQASTRFESTAASVTPAPMRGAAVPANVQTQLGADEVHPDPPTTLDAPPVPGTASLGGLPREPSWGSKPRPRARRARPRPARRATKAVPPAPSVANKRPAVSAAVVDPAMTSPPSPGDDPLLRPRQATTDSRTDTDPPGSILLRPRERRRKSSLLRHSDDPTSEVPEPAQAP